MTRAIRVNATMDEEILRRVDAFAASRYEDRSTALRQLVDFALRELTKARGARRLPCWTRLIAGTRPYLGIGRLGHPRPLGK